MDDRKEPLDEVGRGRDGDKHKYEADHSENHAPMDDDDASGYQDEKDRPIGNTNKAVSGDNDEQHQDTPQNNITDSTFSSTPKFSQNTTPAVVLPSVSAILHPPPVKVIDAEPKFKTTRIQIDCKGIDKLSGEKNGVASAVSVSKSSSVVSSITSEKNSVVTKNTLTEGRNFSIRSGPSVLSSDAPTHRMKSRMNHRRRNRRDYDSDEEDEDDNAIYGFDCDDDNRTRRSHGEHTRATFDSEVYNSVGAVAVYSDGVLVSQSPAVLTQPTEQEQRQHEVEAQSITNATVNAESEAGVKDAGTTKKSGSSIPLGNDESPDLRQNNDESCANATAEVLVATATLAGSNTIKSSLAKIKPSDTMIHNDYDDEKAVKLPWYYSLVLWGIVGALIVVVGVVIAIVLVTGEKKPNANIPPTPSPSPTNPIIAPAATPMLDSVFVRHIVDERGISGTDVLRDPSSPQHKAYAWLAEEDKATVFSDWLSEEEIKTMATRYILAVFYYALQGDNWFKSHGWLDSNVNHCKWQFVDCRIVGEGNDVTDAAFRGVTGIRNENNRLDGWLPNEVLYLSDLVFLELSGNNIQGFEPLVEGFGFDSLKHLVLSKNPLRSHEAVFRLTNLETLILSDTGISGTLSTDVQKLSNMRKLELADNKLNGTLDARFQTMTRLERLVLDGNRFEGTLENILDCGNCSTTLASFSSKQNPLSGSFPPGLFGFSVLSNFALSKSRLTGSIPSGFGRLVSLTNLNLAENDYDFSPDDENNVLPSELGRLTNLKNLEVSGSNVFGTVPSELSNLSRLDYLGIAATSQTGSIAEEICAIDSLRTIRHSSGVACSCPGDVCQPI